MRAPDLVRFTGGSVSAHRLRTILTALGIAVGIAAVMLLTSIGEGCSRFVLAEFTQFGTNIISVTPGHDRRPGRLDRRVRHRAPADASTTPRRLRRAPYAHGVRARGAGQRRGRGATAASAA